MDVARGELNTDVNLPCTSGDKRQAVGVVHAEIGRKYVYAYPQPTPTFSGELFNRQIFAFKYL